MSVGRKIKVTNQIVITFVEKDIKLKNKTENKEARFLVVFQMNETSSTEKEFVIVLAKTKDELHGDRSISEYIPWKSTTTKLIRTDRVLDFEDWYILKEKDGKYFIKKQNEVEEFEVNVKIYPNKEKYDFDSSPLKEKISKLKPLIFEKDFSSTNISENEKINQKINEKKY